MLLHFVKVELTDFKIQRSSYKSTIPVTIISLIYIYIINFVQALSWGKEMVAMSGSGPGYCQKVIITPYMHCLIYHVPVMMQRHGSLRRFSGQGIFDMI